MQKKKLRGYVASLFKNIRSFIFVVFDFLFPQTDLERIASAMTVADIQKYVSVHTEENGSTTLFTYRTALMRNMIWLLKYRGHKGVATTFGIVVSEYLMETLADATLFENAMKPLLVPMPRSELRMKESGFNQTALVAQVIAEHCGNLILAENALKKTRETKPQTTLSKKERLVNLKGSFEADPRVVKGRTIILFDDVITTGSTMREAQSALKRAGARHVMCIAIAR